MKKSAIILILLMPVISLAQNYQGMNEQDMQKMMQQMHKMESCMQNVDREKLKVIEKRTDQFEAETQSLCASGKREQAQAKAMAFAKEMKNDPTLQAMNKCSAMMKGVMPVMEQDEDYTSDHVCD